MAATYIVRKVITGLTEKQLRDNFPVFGNFGKGAGGMNVDNHVEELEDGTKVHVGYRFERIKTPQE